MLEKLGRLKEVKEGREGKYISKGEEGKGMGRESVRPFDRLSTT
jgi:hypothetical protein